jgi:oxygen-dependent protoporphyrinogen oxidase
MRTFKLAVVGGGIAGLAGAREARLAAECAGVPLEVTLFEASDRLGGKIWTEHIDRVAFEWGPDCFLAAKPRGVGLAWDLGLQGDLVSPGPLGGSAYLWLKGRLRRLPPGMVMGVPTGALSLLTAVRDGIVGPLGALRASIEPLLPRPRRWRKGDPTVEEVARHRLGTQASSRLIAPLIGGVFGVLPAEVGMRSALPQLAESRSWVLTMAKRPTSSGPVFYSLRGGLARLVDAVVTHLPAGSVRTGEAVTRLSRQSGGFALTTPGGVHEADAVLLASQAHAAAPLLHEIAPETAQTLELIRYHASAVALLHYEPDSIRRSLDASGFLVAPEEERAVAGCSWLNSKWPHQNYDGIWIRAIVTSPGPLAAPDEALRSRIAAEVNEAIDARRSPEEIRMMRWRDSQPVYSPGHAPRIEAALSNLPAGLALAGAAVRGFGIPDCIATGEEAARRLVGGLASTP